MDLSDNDIQKRLALWIAFSDLFLDTEITETSHKYIARIVKESPYSAEEVNDILWLEVFPAVCDNLRNVAGEWAGFEEHWLSNRIINVMSGSETAFSNLGLLTVKQVISITEEEWDKCCNYLTDDYSKLIRPPDNKINPGKKATSFFASLFKR